MRIGKSIFLAIIGLGFGFFSCVDHAANDEEQQEQLRLDSIAQADTDNELIDDYIADQSNGIDADDVVVGEYGVRYVVWDPASSIKTPEYSDLVSVHYTGKFLSNKVFDTISESRAKKSDSLNYVDEGISFEDLLEQSNKSYEKLLDSLNSSDGAIEDPQFNDDRLYLPLVFNHTSDGSGIEPGFIRGFSSGLAAVMLKMELNSTALIMIPSAAAYGIAGSPIIGEEQTVPPNTVLLFEFTLVNIRP